MVSPHLHHQETCKKAEEIFEKENNDRSLRFLEGTFICTPKTPNSTLSFLFMTKLVMTNFKFQPYEIFQLNFYITTKENFIEYRTLESKERNVST